MEEALQFVIKMNEWTWDHFKDALKDLSREEIDWRPLAQANSINLILRHLCIEAKWHLQSIEHGEPMPTQVTASGQQLIDSVPVNFERNLEQLEELYTRFVGALRRTTMSALQQQSVLAYQEFRASGFLCPAHFLGFHQAVHLAGHGGQIRTIRNLYRRTRGELGRFFPDNPTFPT